MEVYVLQGCRVSNCTGAHTVMAGSMFAVGRESPVKPSFMKVEKF